MKTLLTIVACCSSLLVAAVYAGPVTSGALLLLLPAHERPTAHDLPADYEPEHKGHVSLDIGRYFRANEDIVVPGTPGLVLRRSYASGDRIAREFGVGTTHAAEWSVIGDGKAFQWAALVRPGEPRIPFNRTSSGSSFFNAMYRHQSSAGEWQGARLGWTGSDWALRQLDGTLARFRGCGPDTKSTCAIVSYRDSDGHVIRYRRDNAGRLHRIEAGGAQWIALEYDDGGRVIRASASTAREVRYEYDERGRLARVKSGGTITHQYTYTDRDELSTIKEPDADIENTYDGNGRCIRQVNRFKDNSEPYIFDLDYTLDGSDVSATRTDRSDGTWTRYTFSKAGFTTSETWGRAGSEPSTFVFERDPTTNAVVSFSLTCPDRTGRQLRHSSLVAPGKEEWLKWDMVRTHCAVWVRSGSSWRTAQ
jgi:YD repeat-containing protein